MGTVVTVDRSYGPATQLAVRNLSTLKPEHQTLLRTLLADRGIASSTLETLAEHLIQEEDPRLQQALARDNRSGATVDPASRAVASSSAEPGETVERARTAEHPARAESVRVAERPRWTVGSLRPDRPVPTMTRGTVGSLRKR